MQGGRTLVKYLDTPRRGTTAVAVQVHEGSIPNICCFDEVIVDVCIAYKVYISEADFASGLFSYELFLRSGECVTT